MYLGRNGLVDAEPTPKGWYITYVDRSPEAMARQAVRILLPDRYIIVYYYYYRIYIGWS